MKKHKHINETCFQLTIVDGESVGKQFPLLEKVCSIGNSHECYICLAIEEIQPIEADIDFTENHHYITPRSKNVVVNEQNLQTTRKLLHHDIISIGKTKLLYGSISKFQIKS